MWRLLGPFAIVMEDHTLHIFPCEISGWIIGVFEVIMVKLVCSGQAFFLKVKLAFPYDYQVNIFMSFSSCMLEI